MTGPFYSPGPIKNITLQASNVSDFINEFRDALLLCNWELVSAFSGFAGTPGYILRSYPTFGNLNRIRLKIYYNGDKFGGVYEQIQILLQDESGGNEQFVGYVMMESDLGNKTLRCILGPHQFFIFIDPTVFPNSSYTARFNKFNNVMGGCPYVRNPLHGNVYWGLGDSGHNATFRSRLAGGHALGGDDFFSYLINSITPWTAAFPDPFGNTGNTAPIILAQRNSDLYNFIPQFDGNWSVTEPILVLGRTPNNTYATYLWDSIVVGTRFASAITTTADNRRWETLTLSTDANVVGSLFLVTDVLVNPTLGGFSY